MTPRRVVLALALAAGAPAGSARADAVTTEASGATVDWTAGEIFAVGRAVADLRAPTVPLARVGAERRARERALAALTAAARALPIAAGGTLGAAMAKDAELAGRVARAIDGAREVVVDHASDGSTRIRMAAALEALRGALVGITLGPTPPTAPTALVIEAGAALGAPRLGLALTAGGERMVGPTVFARGAGGLAGDPRLGDRVLKGRARRLVAGALEIEGGAASALGAARAADAIVVVILRDRRGRGGGDR
jgi:hypothetical protein